MDAREICMYQPALIQTTDGIASNSLMGIGDVIVVNTELDLAAGTVVDSWLSLLSLIHI